MAVTFDFPTEIAVARYRPPGPSNYPRTIDIAVASRDYPNIFNIWMQPNGWNQQVQQNVSVRTAGLAWGRFSASGLPDLTILLSSFGDPTAYPYQFGDLDGDALVTLGDLTLLLSQFGSTCSL